MIPDFTIVEKFEQEVAKFFGAPFAVAVDSCTHGIELCLRYHEANMIHCPKRTYLSVPILANKLNITLNWIDLDWTDYYPVYKNIYDAAVLWKENSYIPNTMMCLSFQYQKHLSLGRGGMILLDNEVDWLELKKMSYDGRVPNIPWRDQDISSIGYHYYMTPETAKLGLDKLPNAIATKPKQWTVDSWPDLTLMSVFKVKEGTKPVVIWLNDLSEPIKRKALYNYENVKKNHFMLEVDSMVEAINSFVWEETAEGHDYWDKISDKYIKW